MEKMHVSQETLSKYCGCRKDVIYYYVNCKCLEENMNITVLKKIAGFFEKPPYYFCNAYLTFIDEKNVPVVLKKLRQEKGMTQSQFAQLYHIPLACYKGYENGKTRLQYKYWKRIFPHLE